MQRERAALRSAVLEAVESHEDTKIIEHISSTPKPSKQGDHVDPSRRMFIVSIVQCDTSEYIMQELKGRPVLLVFASQGNFDLSTSAKDLSNTLRLAWALLECYGCFNTFWCFALLLSDLFTGFAQSDSLWDSLATAWQDMRAEEKWRGFAVAQLQIVGFSRQWSFKQLSWPHFVQKDVKPF